MSGKRYNFKTQKGILAHCTDLQHDILPCEDAETAFAGQPATFHIGSDCYAVSVERVDRTQSGKLRQIVASNGARFAVKVGANCTSGGGRGFDATYHRSFLDGVNTTGWLEVGVAVTRLDPSF